MTSAQLSRPESLVYFSDASLAYEMAAGDWKAASNRVLETRAALVEIRGEIEEIESEVIVGGGFGDYLIGGENGKNETQRKAQLIVALAHHGAYQVRVRDQREIEADQRSAEADMTDAEHRMRGARLRLEWSTSWVSRLSAVEGGASMKGEKE